MNLPQAIDISTEDEVNACAELGENKSGASDMDIPVADMTGLRARKPQR